MINIQINEQELQELISQKVEEVMAESGINKKVWWSMSDLKYKTGMSAGWLKEKILLRPKFKKILDIENGGCAYYPQNQGEKWCFIASQMNDFLENHFGEIYGKRS